MKREDILAMEAGRELDALVAEKVMGWKWNPDYSAYMGGGCSRNDDEWNPSTDISASWEVVEKADIVEISKQYRGLGEWYWGVCLKGQYTYAKSVPEAICKAALLTILEGQTHEA